jgi:hypothetical protein
MCLTIKVQFLARERDFSILSIVQTVSVSHLASYTMNNGSFFPEVKAAGT